MTKHFVTICASLAASAIMATHAAQADTTASSSNAPQVSIDQPLMSLLAGERDALGKVTSNQLIDMMNPPADASTTAAAAKGSTKTVSDDQLQCLAQVLYHEARGESRQGQKAVAEVVLNRVDDPAFPNTICGVVNQGNGRSCQFSWTCDGRSDKIANRAVFSRVSDVARAMAGGAPRDVTSGATYFHTPAVHPSWSKRFVRTARVGAHIFYRKPVRTASN
ncbi:cell wall hydrolase [Rhodobacteraceae bacterium]|nr:cell wall hydrolase [Paracoccaceae bacterium]